MSDSNRGKGEESPTGNGKVRSRSRSASDGDGSKKNEEEKPDITLRNRTMRGRTPHGAMGYFAARRFSKDFSGAVQTDKDIDHMSYEIFNRQQYIDDIKYQREVEKPGYVIKIEEASIDRNIHTGVFEKVDFSFWLPIHEGYRIHIKINFDKLGESDKENMGKVVFWNSRWGKICSLLDLYLCMRGEMSDYIRTHFMGLKFENKTYGLEQSIKRAFGAFDNAHLTIEGENYQPLQAVILKAGELSDGYPEHTRPYLLGMIRTVLTNRRQRGGRVQRQRRRGRTIISRKKRNTRMKKSKKYNKSKKIKK